MPSGASWLELMSGSGSPVPTDVRQGCQGREANPQASKDSRKWALTPSQSHGAYAKGAKPQAPDVEPGPQDPDHRAAVIRPTPTKPSPQLPTMARVARPRS